VRVATEQLCCARFGVESAAAFVGTAAEWKAALPNLIQGLEAYSAETRVAACRALTLLLRGRRWTDLSGHYEWLWRATVRVMDDMEENVLKAATPLSRTLKGLAVSACDADTSPLADVLEALPTTVELMKALTETNSNKAVCLLCLDTLKASLERAGSHTQLLLSKVVPFLIEALAASEDRSLAYTQFHAESLGYSQAQFESARVALSQRLDSTHWATLQKLVPMVDPPRFAELVPALSQLLRTGVGHITRVGVCQFITWVAGERGRLAIDQTAANTMLKVLSSSLTDPSVAVQRASATAFAHMGRLAAHDTLAEVTRRLFKAPPPQLSDEASRASYRKVAGTALIELARKCGEHLDELKGEMVGLAFVLRFASDEGTSKVWTELWDELAPSESAAIDRFLTDISKQLIDGLSSPSRADKTDCCKCIAALTDKLFPSLLSRSGGSVPDSHCTKDERAELRRLYDTLHSFALSLPTFTGGAAVAAALLDIAAVLTAIRHPPDTNQLIQGVSSYAHKSTVADRTTAVRAIEKYIHRRAEMKEAKLVDDVIEPQVAPVLKAIATQVLDKASDTAAEADQPSASLDPLMVACLQLTEVLLAEQPRDALDSDALATYVRACVDWLVGCSWKVKLDILRSVQRLISRAMTARDGLRGIPLAHIGPTDLVRQLLRRLVAAAAETKISKLKMAGGETLDALAHHQISLLRDYHVDGHSDRDTSLFREPMDSHGVPPLPPLTLPPLVSHPACLGDLALWQQCVAALEEWPSLREGESEHPTRRMAVRLHRLLGDTKLVEGRADS